MQIPGLDDDFCPHCLNGGGKGSVSLAAKGEWTLYEPLNANVPFRHDAGLCGDPISDSAPREHENGGRFGPPKNYPTVAQFSEGEIIDITCDITTNHQGFFQFFICDASKCGGDITESCFKDGYCHELLRVPDEECESQNSRECGPIDPTYPGRFYVPCRKGPHVGEHFIGGQFMRYQLPEGFSTDHAVIQWYWATANSCNPPGYLDYFNRFPMPGWGSCPGDGGAKGGRNPTFPECGGSLFPEEFWTCADVSVGSPKQNPSVPSVSVPTSTPTPTSAPTQNNNEDDEADDGQDGDDDDKEKSENDCIIKWQQCGGLYHKNSTECCDSDYECRPVNQYYSQCMRQ